MLNVIKTKKFSAEADNLPQISTPPPVSLQQLSQFQSSFSQRMGQLRFSAIISALVIVLVSLTVPLLTLLLVDWLNLNSSKQIINILFIGLVTVGLFAFLINAIRSYAHVFMGRKTAAILGEMMYPDRVEETTSSANLSKMHAIENIKNFYAQGANTLFWESLFSLFYIGMIYLIEPLLAGVLLSSMPFFLVGALFLSNQMMRDHHTRESQLAVDQNLITHKNPSSLTHKIAILIERQFMQDNAAKSAHLLGKFLQYSVLLIMFYLGARLVVFDQSLRGTELFHQTLTLGGLTAVMILSFFYLSTLSKLPMAAFLRAKAKIAFITLTEFYTASNKAPHFDDMENVTALYGRKK